MMIRTDREYLAARARLKEDIEKVKAQKERLIAKGASNKTIHNTVDISLNLLDKWQEDINFYANLKEGNIEALRSLSMNKMLIGIRIFKGVSQTELAKRLKVSLQTVSRDERNEYHGITVEKYERILNALEVQKWTILSLETSKTAASEDEEPDLIKEALDMHNGNSLVMLNGRTIMSNRE